MKQSQCTSYKDLPLFLSTKKGLPPKPSESGSVGRGGTAEGMSFRPWADTKDMKLVPTRCTSQASRCCVWAAEWWSPKRSSFSGRRSGLEVPNEKAELAQAGSHQKLFSSAQ